jgi:hypothetical protein
MQNKESIIRSRLKSLTATMIKRIEEMAEIILLIGLLIFSGGFVILFGTIENLSLSEIYIFGIVVVIGIGTMTVGIILLIVNKIYKRANK